MWTSLPVLSLALLAAPAGGAPDPEPDPRIARLLEAVSEERLAQTIRSLAGFGTRHTFSAAETPGRGIGAARQWISDELAKIPRLQVSFDTYAVPKQGERLPRDVELRNVVALLPGHSPRRGYVSGHYDSVAGPKGGAAFEWSPGDRPAPGAHDDGAAPAPTTRLGRLFAESGLEFDATLAFVAFAGEEEALVGSSLHARKAAAEKIRIDAVLNNDIIGNVTGGDGVVDSSSLRVFSEGPEDSPSRAL